MARYEIIPERSPLAAEARSSVHPIRVEATGFQGYLDLELADGRLDLAAPVGGHVEFPADRVKTGNRLYDYELDRRLDVRRYPRMTGDVREIRPRVGGNGYRMRGDLTFHGVTRSVEGDLRVRPLDDQTIEVEGELQLDMRDFGLEPPKLLMLRVHPDVRVRARAIAKRAS